jgi:ribonucleoside-triphosphate reductase (thioredoxin)
MPVPFSFRLTEDFVAGYRDRKAPFGYRDAGGNSVGEITFLRTYSRKKEDGTKETWVEVCERVINGMYSIQKDHCKDQRLPWNDNKAQASAKEAFDRLFNLKWTPPGRGLWVMGTPIVNVQKNSAALQNCAFVSTLEMTKSDPALPFAWLMEASMLGVGVGFDAKGADKGFTIHEPKKVFGETESGELIPDPYEIVIPDSREGWVESVARLINSYLKPDQAKVTFSYDDIRPAGEPIKTFGGTAAGPDSLIKLHQLIRILFFGRATQSLTRKDVADIGNMIGVCVVSGNVRRSAELLIGSIEDEEFLNLKNYGTWDSKGNLVEEGPAMYRQAWGFMSNNSVDVAVGQDLSPIIEGVARNGEPGVIWMDMSRKYGRLADAPNNKDWRVAGYNPCAEQSLESFEMCTLVETYLNRHETLEDYKRTLKFAYLYAKTVTLLPTHWEQTNAIMQRNRRIGTSMSGVANFADNRGLPVLRQWMDEGYATIGSYDNIYSEWLGIRESIKTTTVKPSGTVSILAGESPGVHWTPGGKYFLRTIRFANTDPMLPLFKMAQYRVEPAFESPDTTSVVYFPVESDAKRSDKEVTIFEKVALAATAQRYWSDNSVSVTVSFNAETESQHVGTVLHMYDGQLKTVSFLPQGNDIYIQMPYSQITEEEYIAYTMQLFPIDFAGVYAGMAADAIGESYCSTDACEVKLIKDAVPV